MIIIHIHPIESDTSDGEKTFEKEVPRTRNQNRYIFVIVFLVCLVIFFLITACSSMQTPSSYLYQVPADLSDGWETISLTDAGVDPEMIVGMMADIGEGGHDNLHSLLIVKDRKLIFEEYFRRHNPNNAGETASVTKSVTSIAICIAIDQGYIESPDHNPILIPTIIRVSIFMKEENQIGYHI